MFLINILVNIIDVDRFVKPYNKYYVTKRNMYLTDMNAMSPICVRIYRCSVRFNNIDNFESSKLTSFR